MNGYRKPRKDKGVKKKHPLRFNQNVAMVEVPICDPCFEGYHTGCEKGNCECQWTHDW